jgi:hypothetical protein
MSRITYMVATATLAALLLIISTPEGMAAEPSGDMNPSMGAPQGPGGSYQGGPSSQTPQGFSPGSKQMGEGMAGQGGSFGPSGRRTYGSDQGSSSGRAGFGQPAQRGSPGQGSAVGEAIVVGVDRPDNCLRIRKGPSSQYEQIGCANIGDRLRLTGVFSNDNRWAQLEDNGWVFACQIKTDLKPPGGSFACGRGGGSYEMWSGPAGFYSGETFGPSYYSGFGPSWYGGHRWRHHGHHGGHHGGGPHKK